MKKQEVKVTYGLKDYRKELLGQDIGWLQEGMIEVLNAICMALVPDSSDVVILSGCQVSYTLPNATITEGYIYRRASKEVLRVEASSVAATNVNDLRLIQAIIPAPWGMVRFGDNVPRQAHVDVVYQATTITGGLGNTGPVTSLARIDSAMVNKLNLTTLLGRIYAVDTWHNVGASGEPAFQSGWGNAVGIGAPLAFKKDAATNSVKLRGHITGGALGGATIFTLPVGYRPLFESYQPVLGLYSGLPETLRLRIRMDSGSEGALSIYATTSSGLSSLSLDGVVIPLD